MRKRVKKRSGGKKKAAFCKTTNLAFFGLVFVAAGISFYKFEHFFASGHPGDARCHNLNPSCHQWAKEDQCNTNPKFMMAQCAQSCDEACGGEDEVEEKTASQSTAAASVPSVSEEVVTHFRPRYETPPMPTVHRFEPSLTPSSLKPRTVALKTNAEAKLPAKEHQSLVKRLIKVLQSGTSIKMTSEGWVDATDLATLVSADGEGIVTPDQIDEVVEKNPRIFEVAEEPAVQAATPPPPAYLQSVSDRLVAHLKSGQDLKVTADGWVDVADLAKALSTDGGEAVTIEHIKEIAEHNPSIFEEHATAEAAAPKPKPKTLVDKIKALLETGSIPATPEGWVDVSAMIKLLSAMGGPVTLEQINEAVATHPDLFDQKTNSGFDEQKVTDKLVTIMHGGGLPTDKDGWLDAHQLMKLLGPDVTMEQVKHIAEHNPGMFDSKEASAPGPAPADTPPPAGTPAPVPAAAPEPSDCPKWAATGECTKNKVYMEANCPQSCERAAAVAAGAPAPAPAAAAPVPAPVTEAPAAVTQVPSLTPDAVTQVPSLTPPLVGVGASVLTHVEIAAKMAELLKKGGVPVDAKGYVDSTLLAKALGVTIEQVLEAVEKNPAIFEETEEKKGVGGASVEAVNPDVLKAFSDSIKSMLNAGTLPTSSDGWLDTNELIQKIPGLTEALLEQVVKNHPETFETKRRRLRRGKGL
jgi:RNA:NAD 2'-phosphotransferase (TPT1/KptA family)